ncbi:MAG: DotG/IcmE/VirB10 family protein [Alphaproteobacteria bacterium]|nr:DotG/IcmE/VirB10 family protein [Alphaproteobacteria bacterium]
MSDELDDDDLDLDESSFDEFDQSEKNTLGDLWRNNSMVKFGVIGAAAVAILGIVIVFGESDTPADQSFIGARSDVRGTPGAEETSPAYIEAVEEKNQERIEQAQKQGTSALPTPVNPPVGRLDIPEQEQEEEDPLQRWRKIQEERLQRELEQSRSVETPIVEETQNHTEAVQAMAEAMSEQMQAILETQNKEVSLRSMQITSPDYLQKLAEAEEAEAAQVAQHAAANQVAANDPALLLPAGEILYAQLITEANSDTPGPVLAQIHSGPLKGSRILGDFEVHNDRYITLNFNTLVYDDRSISVDAIAVDPSTTSTGMATEVDQRYFQRVVLPAAAAFIEGAAEAIANTGLTTITVEGDTVAQESQDASNEQEIASGIEEAGQELGDILDRMGQQTRVLVKVDSGTRLGILFLQDVYEGGARASNSTQTTAQQPQP